MVSTRLTIHAKPRAHNEYATILSPVNGRSINFCLGPLGCAGSEISTARFRGPISGLAPSIPTRPESLSPSFQRQHREDGHCYRRFSVRTESLNQRTLPRGLTHEPWAPSLQ